ncbi:MAG: tRNA (adenosine(37)-N6)-threonylcarbamoyltransferase complex ATPase subunit type 1 TsaE [Treponema sp.]|jgi:tRNA threonylcarbamoyladenosine biosynthesis protein TsaE|nr:tRNA (adenosine(37)-N6)-threonylcarbamoyltransferase complex ATPase subunit type 1 TsaE [Treponema sp.]
MSAGHFLTEFISSSPEETMALGERIARFLHQGSIVALRGGLGAGKTYLTKGIARGLGVSEEVTSPTYTIISEYEGNLPFYHIDAYRLQGDDDFSALGGEEILYGAGVSVIEWSERISIPEYAIIVELEIRESNHRKILIRNLER